MIYLADSHGNFFYDFRSIFNHRGFLVNFSRIRFLLNHSGLQRILS